LAAKDTLFYTKNTLRIRGKLVELDRPKVMGIINLTPDSFFDGGRLRTDKAVAMQAEKLVNEGADFIDIGGYSSRPGAEDIPIDEEKMRVEQGLRIMQKQFPDSYISVDTFRSSIAGFALEHGADMINDISGGSIDDEMYETVARYKAPYIMMHMKGTPQTMKTRAKYDDLLSDIMDFFVKRIKRGQELGLGDIIIDPGIGFAKTIAQNYEILKNLDYFKVLNLPLLVGVSRKSLIYKTLNTTPDNALNGTTVLHTLSLLKGANILRVHDVQEAKETIEIINQLQH